MLIESVRAQNANIEKRQMFPAFADKISNQMEAAVKIDIKQRKLGQARIDQEELSCCYGPQHKIRKQHSVAKEEQDLPTPDIDGSGAVDLADLVYLLSKFGQRDARADFNGNGKVDQQDLRVLLDVFGSKL